MGARETRPAGLLRMVVLVQMAWAVCSAAWNVVGSMRVSQGLLGLGPTASLPAAAVLVGLAAVLPVVSRRWRAIYVVLSALVAIGAGVTVYGAFTKSPDLWPSDAWRYLGAVLNTLGVFASLTGIAVATRSTD